MLARQEQEETVHVNNAEQGTSEGLQMILCDAECAQLGMLRAFKGVLYASNVSEESL
jgi:hypothetical protein